MPKSLKGKNVLVTGAGGRLGRVVAAKFQEIGSHVLGIDADADAAATDPCYHADLTDDRSVRDVMAQIQDEHGGIDVLIHTVGMWDGHPTASLEYDRWQRVMNVNLTSAFLCFREMLRPAISADEIRPIRLIAFASRQGADRGLAEQAAYSAAKAGIVRLVESVADEYGDLGVTAHAIAPSMILFDGMEEEAGISVHDVANLCVVLAGDAGTAMNGVTVRAYGSLE